MAKKGGVKAAEKREARYDEEGGNAGDDMDGVMKVKGGYELANALCVDVKQAKGKTPEAVGFEAERDTRGSNAGKVA